MSILAGCEKDCLPPTGLPLRLYGKITKECKNLGCFHDDHVRRFFTVVIWLNICYCLQSFEGTEVTGGTATGQKLICCLWRAWLADLGFLFPDELLLK